MWLAVKTDGSEEVRSKTTIAGSSSEPSVLTANHKFCNLFGYTNDQILGSPWRKFIHPKYIETTMARFQQAIASNFDQFTPHYVNSLGETFAAKDIHIFFRDQNNSPIADLITITPLDTPPTTTPDPNSTTTTNENNNNKSSTAGALMIPTKSLDYVNLNLEALRGKTTQNDETKTNDSMEKGSEVGHSEDILNSAFNPEEDHTAIWNHNHNSLEWNVKDV